jgi:hypothetical protein
VEEARTPRGSAALAVKMGSTCLLCCMQMHGGITCMHIHARRRCMDVCITGNSKFPDGFDFFLRLLHKPLG